MVPRTARKAAACYGLKIPSYKPDALQHYMSQRALEVHWRGHHRTNSVEAPNNPTLRNGILYGYTVDGPVKVTCNIIMVKEPYTISSVLSVSEKTRSSVLGAQIHCYVIKLGFNNDTFSINNLIKMYSKCGFLADGLKMFQEMPQRNIVSWTLAISAANENGEPELSLEIFLYMIRNGLRPNEFTVGSVMKACTNMGAYGFGLCVHCLVLKTGMEQNLFVGGSVFNVYIRSGDIESAELIFACMEKVDICLWNALIGGSVQCGSLFEAMNMVSLMHCRGVPMDHFTFVNALKGCSVTGALALGKQLHGLIIQSKVKSCVSVMNSLMHMYVVNGRKTTALKILNSMQSKDIISWNIVFGASSKDMEAKQIASLFRAFMLEGMKPNHLTFSGLFRQCGELLEFKLGLQFCSIALRLGLFDGPTVSCTLIKMFSQLGLIEMACLVFDSIQFKPVIVWNELIYAYKLNGDYMDGLRTFTNLWGLGVQADEYTFSITLEACSKSDNLQMVRQVNGAAIKSGFGSHGYVCSPLIKSYVKFGLIDDSLEFFKGHERLDLASWGAMVSALVHHNHTCEAIMFLNTLIESGEKPDELIFASILNGCSSIASYHQTKSVHTCVNKMGFEMHACVASALVDAYAKCGDIKSAQFAFEHAIQSDDVVIYNSMIIAYAHHGLAHEAIQTFEKMEKNNVQPSGATFVAILSACSHLGLVDQGCYFFGTMKSKYGIEPSPDHFGCLVDLLSRNGYLYDARDTIVSMPFPPWPAILRSLLSGCKIHGHRELGEWTARKLFELAPKDDAAYVLLSNLYSQVGSWEDSTKLRRGMMDRGILKDPGHSLLEIG